MSTPDMLIVNESGQAKIAQKLAVKLIKPLDDQGQPRDQTDDAAKHVRHAATHNLPRITEVSLPFPMEHHAVIVGGGPSIEGELENIRALAADKRNKIFALNWAHTWLIKQGIIPDACVMFEIDVDPCGILETSHPDVTYYVCTHCHPLTVDGLAGRKIVLWHTPPNSPGEKVALDELFPNDIHLGGGIATFLRTVSLAIAIGYRNFDIFGCDSSFPADAESTHVTGYPTPNKPSIDSFNVHTFDEKSGEKKCFRSVGYLAYQVEEFKHYCRLNHQLYRMRVHGDTLLAYTHRKMWAHQYEDSQNASVP